MATQDKGLIHAYVTNKFVTSPYIKERKYPDPNADIKYYPEEISYWVNQITNSNWELSVFDSEFDATYSIDHDRSLTNAASFYNDYIGQTFLIDGKSYPKGMFLSKITIFVRQESPNETITLDVRPLVNGVPGDPIPMSKVVVEQTTEEPQTHEWNPNSDPTSQFSKLDFTFDFPIYLSAGYYCFTLKTNSFNFSVFISENGIAALNSDKVVVNPYLGDFIYSNQGTSWVVDPTKDMCFILYQAVFDVGDATLYLNTKDRPTYDFDTVTLATAVKEFSEISYISDCQVGSYDYYTDIATQVPVILNSNVNMPSHSKIHETDGVPFTLTLKNTDKNLTPLIDLDATGVKLIKNQINEYSLAISESELTVSEGQAYAKYVSKAVTLNEDFDADGITLYVDVNKPIGTSIEVFYRVLNRYDNNLELNETIWYRLTKKSSITPTLLASDYIEELYEDLNISYSGVNGVRYDSFNRLQVKIVMYSEDKAKVPSIKNLRVIATV
jgi:hypothetical protein